jgi:hypothetical protein
MSSIERVDVDEKARNRLTHLLLGRDRGIVIGYYLTKALMLATV